MKLKKVSSMILAVTLACTMTVTPVLADEVSDLKQKKQETQNQVSNLQTQLNSLMTKISDLENDLIETGEEISQTEEDLKTAQEEQEQQYAAMKLRIKYMYEEGTGTATVEKVLTSGDISSVLTQAEYSQQVHSYDRDKLEEYVATVQKVEDLKTTLETKMADLQETQTEYDAQKDELNTTITEKSSEIANLDVKIDEAVKKAAEEEAKRKAAEAAAKVDGKVIGVDSDQSGIIGEDITVTSAMKGLAPTVKTALDAIKDGNWESDYAGKIDNLGLVSENPEDNYVQLPMETTQWDDNFTVDDYKDLVKKLYNGEIEVSSDITAMPETEITVNDYGSIK